METLGLVLVVILSVFVTLMFGALVELQRQLVQVRRLAGFVDETSPVPINRMASLAYVLDENASGRQMRSPGHRFVIFVLSDSCLTCRDMVEQLATAPTDDWVAFVESSSNSDAQLWLAGFGLLLGENWIHDDGGGRARYLGVSVTPAAVRFEGDLPSSGETIPSVRQLQTTLGWLKSSQQAADNKSKEAIR